MASEDCFKCGEIASCDPFVLKFLTDDVPVSILERLPRVELFAVVEGLVAEGRVAYASEKEAAYFWGQIVRNGGGYLTEIN